MAVMSRAFVNEDNFVEGLPDRPISEHPNQVMQRGLALIESGLAAAPRQHGEVQVSDEADPARGSISHVSPLARSLLGKRVGETIRAGKDDAEITAIN